VQTQPAVPGDPHNFSNVCSEGFVAKKWPENAFYKCKMAGNGPAAIALRAGMSASRGRADIAVLGQTPRWFRAFRLTRIRGLFASFLA